MKISVINYRIAANPDIVPDPDRSVAVEGGRADAYIVADHDLAAIISNKKTTLLTPYLVETDPVIHLEPGADPKPRSTIYIDYRHAVRGKRRKTDIKNLEFIQRYQPGNVVIKKSVDFSR